MGPERRSSGNTILDGVFAMKEGLDTYVEARMSPERDRWILVRIEELQFLLEKLKRWLVYVQKKKMFT